MEQRLAMTTIALAAVLLTSTGVVFVGMAMARGDPMSRPWFLYLREWYSTRQQNARFFSMIIVLNVALLATLILMGYVRKSTIQLPRGEI